MDSSPPPKGAAFRRWGLLVAFIRSNTNGGTVLVLAACAALAWSNSPASPSYQAMLHLPIGLSAGPASLSLSLHAWVNDLLMAVFFLLVGLEIRHEMSHGELASLRRVAGPGIAALGGMAAPALIYVACNHADPAALRGWAIPVATDIAFALAALNLLGARIPASLKVFLTALAIIDDIGAIIVIAVFYTASLDWIALAAGALVLALLAALSRAGIRSLAIYIAGGVLLWAAIYRSGIHATLAGVALAFVIPAQERPGETGSPARRLELGLQTFVAFVILPLFGLFNAGLQFNTVTLAVLVNPVFIGIAAGLLIGKQIGVFAVTYVASRLQVIHLPRDLTWPIVYGGSLLCGIGFTMSLFIGDLAFQGQDREAEMKLAVFCGSLVSAALGLIVLRIFGRARPGNSAS